MRPINTEDLAGTDWRHMDIAPKKRESGGRSGGPVILGLCWNMAKYVVAEIHWVNGFNSWQCAGAGAQDREKTLLANPVAWMPIPKKPPRQES